MRRSQGVCIQDRGQDTRAGGTSPFLASSSRVGLLSLPATVHKGPGYLHWPHRPHVGTGAPVRCAGMEPLTMPGGGINAVVPCAYYAYDTLAARLACPPQPSWPTAGATGL